MAFDPNELTLGDMEDLETASGIPFDKITEALSTEGTAPPIALVIALVWVMRRKSEIGLKLEDVRSTRIADISAMFGEMIGEPTVETDPTDAVA